MSGAINRHFAQNNYKAYSYSLKDGVSSELCRSLYKDKQGFVWISSDKGLNRYDGNSVYTFAHNPSDPRSIASNRCNYIFEDSKQRLWVNTDEGLSLYDRKSQTFTNFYPDPDILPLQGLSYTEMAEDHQGNVWIGGYYDVLIFNPSEHKFRKSGWHDFAAKAGIIKEEKRNSISQSITRKSKDELWILTVYGLFSVHTPSMVFHYYPNPEISDYFAFNIGFAEKEKVWISTYDKCFYSYHVDTDTWTHYSCPEVKAIEPGRVVNIARINKDSLLITKPEALYVFDVKSYQYRPYKTTEDPADKTKTTFRQTLVSENQIFALKTGSYPLVHYIREKSNIRHTRINQPKSFVNNHSYITSSGKILMGDWEKRKVLVCENNTCFTLVDDKGNDKLGALQLYYCSKNGNQYFSTSEAVYQWDEKNRRVTLLSQEFSISAEPVTEFRNFTEDPEGNIYIRDRNSGIYVLKAGAAKIVPFDTGIKSNGYSALYYDPANAKIWFATEREGLFITDPKTKICKNYPLSDLSRSKKGYINDIHGDEKGNIFLLMPSRGLMHIRSDNMAAKLYSTSEGLISDAVRYGLYSGEYFWFTTEYGLMAFDLSKERFYSFADEPESKAINYRIFEDQHGNIAQNLFPDEILILDKSALKKEKNIDNLYIKEITVFGKKQTVDSFMVLRHDQNNLSLQFGYLGTGDIPSEDFQFRINNQAWQPLQEMAIHLYNIPHGDYNLNVRYRHKPEKTLAFRAKILPPWWQTWWFYSLVASILSLMIFWVYKWRIKNIRKEEKEKNQFRERIARIEMSALRAQMNPHFIFNCLSSINRFILINDTEAASEYLTKFSRLIRMILDGSRSDFIPLDKELEALRLYIEMESMRFQDSFEWHIQIDKEVNPDRVQIPPLILQPYAENAIWHGLMQAPANWGIKKLDINVSEQMEKIIITITDNGIGRDKARELNSKNGNKHKSYGISLTGERLQLMESINGIKTGLAIHDLKDKSGQACGTQVVITINE